MTAYLSTELGQTANQTSAPVGYKPAATVYMARIKRMRATFTLNTQTTSDTLVIGNLPPGATFLYGILNTDTSLGATATLAIGNSTTTDKYRAAATFTSTNTPTLFGKTAAAAADPLSAAEQVIGTIAAANLPASGTLVVDLFYSQPN